LGERENVGRRMEAECREERVAADALYFDFGDPIADKSVGIFVHLINQSDMR
jgi:hypothetical protein